MIRPSLLIASCLALSCADAIPGVDPPGDELYFPVGLTVLPDAADQPAYLAVLSSNFDQRYNSGTITAYSLAELEQLATGCGESFCFSDTLRPAQADTVRVFSFGGDLVYVKRPGGDNHLFVAARGRNRLSMINVNSSGDGKLLSCSTEGAELVLGSDCTRAYVVDTGFSDPFSLTFAPAFTPTTDEVEQGRDSHGDLIAIGHVDTLTQSDVVFGAVSLASVDVFEDRVDAERGGGTDLPQPLGQSTVSNFGGASGIAHAREALGIRDVFITTNLHTAPNLNVSVFVPALVQPEPAVYLLASVEPLTIQLSTQISAIEARALAISSDGTRAYASVRFFGRGNVSNAGIAVLNLTGDRFEIAAVLEVGQELQQPFLHEIASVNGTARFAYVGDLRRDKIFVIDVTTDRPILVKELDGRMNRVIDGESVQVRLLDGPTQIAFAPTTSGGTYAYVTNFSNSTLAVLDVSDPDPRQHRIIARLGRNIDAEGEVEKP